MVKKFADELNAFSETKILEAISALKQVNQIAEHTAIRDSVDDFGKFHVCFNDPKSKKVIEELFDTFVDSEVKKGSVHSQAKTRPNVTVTFVEHRERQVVSEWASEALPPTGTIEFCFTISQEKRAKFLERLDDYLQRIGERNDPATEGTWSSRTNQRGNSLSAK